MTALSGSQIKQIKLISSKSKPKDGKLFVIEGEKIILEAIQNPHIKIQSVFATQKSINKIEQTALPQHQKSIFSVSEKVLERISNFKNNTSSLAVLEKNFFIPPVFSPWILALDNIQDPGNLGTIIRTCDWFGVEKIILSEDCVYHLNPKVVQSAMGSIFRVSVEYQNLQAFLKSQNADVFLATLNGLDYRCIKFSQKKNILVLGNESRGISEDIQKMGYKKISIPPASSQVDSLNVSVACGVLLSAFGGGAKKN